MHSFIEVFLALILPLLFLTLLLTDPVTQSSVSFVLILLSRDHRLERAGLPARKRCGSLTSFPVGVFANHSEIELDVADFLFYAAQQLERPAILPSAMAPLLSDAQGGRIRQKTMKRSVARVTRQR